MTRHQSDFSLTAAEAAAFVAVVWDHSRRNRRDLPWRRTRDAYEILVSEIMLQQTQVARVLVKYGQFLASFPTVRALTAAPTADVLAAWRAWATTGGRCLCTGRRRSYVELHEGRIPTSPEELRLLPGIGPATAAAVCVFAFGRPQRSSRRTSDRPSSTSSFKDRRRSPTPTSSLWSRRPWIGTTPGSGSTL